VRLYFSRDFNYKNYLFKKKIFWMHTRM
jgi:hypothetical protein